MSKSVSSRMWEADLRFYHDGYQGKFNFLVVKVHDSNLGSDVKWQKQVVVDLKTGDIWPDFDFERHWGRDSDLYKQLADYERSGKKVSGAATLKAGSDKQPPNSGSR